MADNSDGGGAPPRSLIVTIYGLYARETGGWIPVSALIELMSQFGVDAPAVRSAISRLKRRGVLLSERRPGSAGYSLSDDARAFIEAGDRRIFERPERHDEGWVLALFSVPESERHRRHQLHARFDWLGFGTVMAGVRIAPAHMIEDAKRELSRVGLAAYVEYFVAEYASEDETLKRVPRWWDLDALQAQYEAFLVKHADATHRLDDPSSPRDAFVGYITVLTAWRRLPYLDPGLPASALPSTWSGTRAADEFFAIRERLDGPAHDFARSVIGR